MKKLSLIIPLSTSSRVIKIFLLISLSMAILPFISKADKYGCFVEQYSFYIFHNEYSEKGGHPNYLFSKDDNNYPDTYYQRDGRCPESDQTTCYLYNFDGSLKAVGYATDFDIANCPIDNYVLLLFMFTSGFAILRIKNFQPFQ